MLNQKKVEIFLAKFHKSLAKQFLEVAFNKKQMNMGKLNVFFLAMVVNIKRNIYSYNGNVL